MDKKKKRKRIPTIVRFFNLVCDKDGKPNPTPTVKECWFWLGNKKFIKHKDGSCSPSYPMFWNELDKKPTNAIHFSYEYFVGRRPRKKDGGNLEISHLCKGQSHCVNPYHCKVEPRPDNLKRSLPLMRELAASARACQKRGIPTCGHPDERIRGRNMCAGCYYRDPDVKAMKRANWKKWYYTRKAQKQLEASTQPHKSCPSPKSQTDQSTGRSSK